MRLAGEPFCRFVGDPAGCEEEQADLEQSGHALHFAMAVVMGVISRLVADPDGPPGHESGYEIRGRMHSLGNEADAAGKEANREFAKGQSRTRQH